MKENIWRIADVFATILIIYLLGFYGKYVDNRCKEPMVTALMFHSISDTTGENNAPSVIITKSNFINNVDYLSSKGFNFIGEDDVRKILNQDSTYDSKNIWLTFDDGYKDNYTVLFPILKEKKLKTLVNIIVSYIENGNPDYPEGYLNWEQVYEMYASNLVDFGSHSFDSHKYIQAIHGKDRPALYTQTIIDGHAETVDEYIERIKSDLAESWLLMNSRMGEAPRIIAYPYGKTNNILDKVAEDTGFDIKIGIQKGINREVQDKNNIKRINISDKYTPEEVEQLIDYYRGISILF